MGFQAYAPEAAQQEIKHSEFRKGGNAMKGLLVRVAVDQSQGGGCWNGPVDSRSGKFVYVSIPETSPLNPGLNKPYGGVCAALACVGSALPLHLTTQDMHLDPDFEHLTYGDQGERAKQIRTKIGPGDLIVFYAGLRDLIQAERLVYALIGLYVVNSIIPAVSVSPTHWHENAHTRRVLSAGSGDIVVRARPGVSGRLERCVPIGDYRNRAYRVRPNLLKDWGGLSVKDGYIQRSARLPEFVNAGTFYTWLCGLGIPLLRKNN